jgi:hypothetical protein
VHEKFKPGLSEALLDRLCGGSGGLSGGSVDVAEFAPCSDEFAFTPQNMSQVFSTIEEL